MSIIWIIRSSVGILSVMKLIYLTIIVLVTKKHSNRVMMDNSNFHIVAKFNDNSWSVYMILTHILYMSFIILHFTLKLLQEKNPKISQSISISPLSFSSFIWIPSPYLIESPSLCTLSLERYTILKFLS